MSSDNYLDSLRELDQISSSTPSLAQSLPYEILLQIFKHSKGTTVDQRHQHLLSVCPQLSSDYRHLWRAVLVCKNWRAIAEEVLYRNIIDLEEATIDLLEATLRVRTDLLDYVQIIQSVAGPITMGNLRSSNLALIKCCSLKLKHLVLKGFIQDLSIPMVNLPALKSLQLFFLPGSGGILDMAHYPNLEVVSFGWSRINLSFLSNQRPLRLKTLILDAAASSLGTRPISLLALILENLRIATTTTRLPELVEVFTAHSLSLRRLSILGEFYEDEEFTRLLYSSLSRFTNLTSLSISIAGNSPSILPYLPSSLEHLELDFGRTHLNNDYLNDFFKALEKESFKCSFTSLRLVSKKGDAFGLNNLNESPPDCLFWLGERGIEVDDCDKLAPLYEFFELS